MNKGIVVRIGRAALDTLLLCLVLGVAVQDFVLSREVRKYGLLAAEAAPLLRDVTPGARLQSLSAASMDGQYRNVALSGETGEQTLIITFSPACPPCMENTPVWTSLAATLAKRPGWRVLWVSRDPIPETREYCLSHSVPLEDVLAEPAFETYVELGMRAVPLTILAGPGGAVQRVWSGRLEAGALDQALRIAGLVRRTPDSGPNTPTSEGRHDAGIRTDPYQKRR